jgi:pimeloyl-ACP methyl ester carboxylesterase
MSPLPRVIDECPPILNSGLLAKNTRQSDVRKRTFVLVPGAWMGAWAWGRVTQILQEEGHTTFPLTLTGMGDRSHLANPQIGVETAIRDVLNAILYEDLDHIVLVGHSFAGKVVAVVADREPDRIDTLLFLDAIRPDKVRTPQGGMADWPESERDGIMGEVREKGDGWKFPLSDELLGSIGPDILGADRDWMLSKVTPLPIRLFEDPVVLSENYDGVKRAYVLCTKGGDDVAAIVKQGLDGEYRILDSGHWPMINKPAELVNAILEIT